MRTCAVQLQVAFGPAFDLASDVAFGFSQIAQTRRDKIDVMDGHQVLDEIHGELTHQGRA